MVSIETLKPQCVWKNFYALTRVPRPSGSLEKIQDYLLNWAESKGIEAFKDGGGNIVMRKPATEGKENVKTAVLQAHMDMVPQVLSTMKHDFVNDPINALVDGEWVKAVGTTLGADDGIGMAIIMAVFEDEELPHGPLEALFTTDEETCMYGVNHLSPDTLKGDVLLNIDNEKEGEFIVGSAGGVNVNASLKYREATTDPTDVAVKITLKNLRGGHSGLEIDEGRANANKLMVRLVRQAIEDDDARLASWHGGNMRNAIPRDCEVVLTLPEENVDDLLDLVNYCRDIYVKEYLNVEERLSLTTQMVPCPETEVPEDIQDNLVDAIFACHNGVLSHFRNIPDVVETSSNLAVVNIGDGKAEILCLVRSAVESQKEYVSTMLESCFNMAGMKVSIDGDYVAWQPNFRAAIIDDVIKVYKDMFGFAPKVQVCHAGLECSLIGSIYPNMELISMGPTICSPHTPDERCNVPSVVKFYSFFCKLLQHLPNK